jgi:hypothetical protein
MKSSALHFKTEQELANELGADVTNLNESRWAPTTVHHGVRFQGSLMISIQLIICRQTHEKYVVTQPLYYTCSTSG